jgi:high-affinity nickel-transport protein
LLYKPWRRRVDKSRASNDHFEPISQDSTILRPEGEELHASTVVGQRIRTKEPDINVRSVEATDIAGPAQR